MNGTRPALAAALLSGIVFGFGLAIAQMTDPQKVKDFLDLAAIPSGGWDPSLAFVMGGAVIVAFFGLRLDRRMPRPVAAAEFLHGSRTAIDPPLVVGAAIFGVGWGLAGFCPGPAIAGLGIIPGAVAPFVASMFIASWLTGEVIELGAGGTLLSISDFGFGMTNAGELKRVLVAGAGPVGLAAALRIERLGLNPVIIAPARTAVDHRTSALLAGSVEFLTRLGVWPLVANSAAPLRSLRIIDGTRRLIRAPEVTFHAGEIGLDAFGYNIPNEVLVGTLEGAVAARSVERREALIERVAPRANDIEASLSSGEEISAPLIVAADGRRSVVREGIGIGVREWRYEQAALVVNLAHALPHDDTSTEFHTEAGPFTLVPLPGRRSSLVWVDRPSETKRRSGLAEAALAHEIEERSQSILGAVAIDGPRQVFPLSGMIAERFGANRVMLVGEAAHLFPPIGAQGLNLGYRDVKAIGDVLAGRSDDPGSADRLAAYDRARRGDIQARTSAVDALNRTLLAGFLPIQGLRGLGLFLLDRVPALRQAVMRRGVALG